MPRPFRISCLIAVVATATLVLPALAKPPHPPQKPPPAKPVATAPRNGHTTFRFGSSIPTVVCAPLHVCDLRLETGETITQVNGGDTLRWKISSGISGTGPKSQAHLLIKPTEPNLASNLVITTDRRTYMIELRAQEALYMPAVAWAYPAPRPGQRNTVPAAPQIPAQAARNYRYGLTGDSPPWRPTSVFDDGRRVYVVFPRGIVQGEMPPLFVIGSDGETQIVNSRIHQNVLIVDRLFGAAELRLGSGERQQVVRILRIEPQQAELRPAATGEAPT